MSQRSVCHSASVIRRAFPPRAVVSSRCARQFHVSVRRREDDSAAAIKSRKDALMNDTSNHQQPRRERNANAAVQIRNLLARPPQRNGLARGVFPSGQGAEKSLAHPLAEPRVITPTRPLVRKQIVRLPSDAPEKEPSGPPGTMVRAPSTLRIRREGAPPAGRAPNLRARGSGPFKAGRGRSSGGGGLKAAGNKTAGGPKKREGGSGSDMDEFKVDQDEIEPQQIDQSLMSSLYRMERNQWDRKPYTPKYAPGSFEANELVHAGRELFKGEVRPVKVWGRLEKTLNIVGMHGAAATLKMRRVPDGDEKPFGKEEEAVEVQQSQTVERKPHDITA